MASEFKIKNGLIVVGDVSTSGTITINGALAATQSWVTSQAYLTSASLSGYATQSYVTSAIAALVNSAPAALDTLNELAAALGNDASFSTTITNSIASKQAQLNGTGFVKVSGTTVSYDNSTYLTSYTETDTLATVTGRGATTNTSITVGPDLIVQADGSVNYTASRLWLNSHNNYRGAGVHMSGVGSTWFAGTPYTDFDGGYVIARTGTSNDVSSAQYSNALLTVKSSGNVGIGTASPTGRLEVFTSSDNQLRLDASGTYSAMYLTQNQAVKGAVWMNHGSLGMFVGTTVSNGYLAFGSDGSYERMRITSAGNVGIGTTSPSYKLDVIGGFNAITSGVNITYDNGILYHGNYYQITSGNNYLLYARGGGALLLGSDDVERVRIASNGNVGIGTTNPAFKFEVGAVGSGYVSAKLTQTYEKVRYNNFDLLGYDDGHLWMIGNNNPSIVLGSSWDWDNQVEFDYVPNTVGAAAGVLSIGQTNKNNANYTHGITRFFTNGSERLRIDSSGNVGIGTSSPSSLLNIVASGSGSTALTVQDNARKIKIGRDQIEVTDLSDVASTMYLQPNSNLVINSNAGNVGIGTQPSSKLHVAGDIRIQNETGLITDYGPLVGRYNTSQVYVGTGGSYSIVKIARADGGALNVLSGGNVGIGTDSPSAKLHVVGNAWINRPSNKVDNASCTELPSRVEFNNAFAAGSTGYTVFTYPTSSVFRIYGDYDGNVGGVQPDLQLGLGYLTVKNSGGTIGNIGIGTTSPSYKLHVVGDLYVNGTNGAFTTDNSQSNLYFLNLTRSTTSLVTAGNVGIKVANPTATLSLGTSSYDNNPLAGLEYSQVTGGGRLDLKVQTWGTGSNYGLTTGLSVLTPGFDTADVRVGIGTTSPATPLHVTGGASGSGGWNRTATLAATYPGLVFNSNGTKWGGMAYDYSAAMRFWVNANNDDIFAGTLAMSILNNGNVGIGTSNPIYKLQVAGSAYVNGGTLFIDSGEYLRWGNSNQGIVGVNDSHVAIVSGGATRQTIYAEGRTYFPGLDLSISNVNGSHGSGTYFRGDGGHFVFGLSSGNTLYLNYGNSAGILRTFGTWYHESTQILSTSRVLTNVSGNISMFTNDAGYLTSVSDIWVNTAGDTMTGSLLFANNADNVRLQKGGSFLNLRDPWDNIHFSNNGGGIYVDSPIHYWRSASGSTYWMTLVSNCLGIGTTNPVTKLHAVGTSTTELRLQNADANNNYGFVKYETSVAGVGGNLVIGTNASGGGYGAIGFSNNNNVEFTGNGDIYLVKGGNVGIGTYSPGAKLHVVGNTYIQSGVLFVDTIAGYATNLVSLAASTNVLVPSGDITIGSAASTSSGQPFGDFSQLKFDNLHSDTNRGPNKIVMHNNGGTWIGGFGIHSDTVSYYTGGHHRWYKTTSQTSSDQVMQLDASGNLSVTGTFSASGYNSSNWNTAYSWGNHASAGYLTSYSETDTLASVTARGSSTSTAVTFNGGVNLAADTGIRKSGDNWIIGYSTSLPGIAIGSGTVTDKVSISSGGTQRVWFDTNGKVGIGTSTPAEELHVIGRGIFNGGSGNSSQDAVVYITKSTNDDWGLYVNNAGLDYGMYTRVSPSANYAFAIHNGTTWTTRITGDGRVHLNNKDTIASYDSWLRLNQSGEYGSGVYTPGLIRADGGFQVSGSTVWHAGNDGTGSGLDADTVDGVQADSIVYGNARGTNQSITNNNNDLDKTGYYTADAFTTRPSGVANWMYIEHIKLYNDNTAYQKQLGYDTYDDRMWVRTKSGGAWSSWKQIWTSDVFANNSSNWNTAYGWGNHASAGYATTSYVTTQINNLIAGAPGALDTLDELAAALGDDSNFATTVTNSIASKLSLSGGTMTGQILFQTSALNNGFRWDVNSDAAGITFKNTGDGDANSYFNFFTEDNGNEYFKFSHNTWNIGSFDFMDVKNGVVRTNGDIYVNASQSGSRSAGTNELINGSRVWHSGDFSSTNVSNWDTAYGWGNHASAGYALNSALANYLPLSGGSIGGALTVNGNLTVNGTITENSSIKLKENVETSEGNLEKVVNLRPVTYNKIGSQTTELGLIAEEVAEVYPEFVQYDENGDPIGIHYSRLTAALIGAVKELTNQVQELNKKING